MILVSEVMPVHQEAARPLPPVPDGVRNFIFLGEAGCGKSEIAVNLARCLAARGETVHLYDLDMTKPLFRLRDQRERLEGMGLRFHFEEQFMDAPTLTGGVLHSLQDRESCAVLDVGGDYTGARSIGGYAPLLNRPDAAVYYIINPFRAWSDTIEHIDRVLGEVLGVSHVELARLRLIGNPNLGPATTAEDVVWGYNRLLEQVAPYKPFDFFCAREELVPARRDTVSHPLFPLRLCLGYPWEEDHQLE